MPQTAHPPVNGARGATSSERRARWYERLASQLLAQTAARALPAGCLILHLPGNFTLLVGDREGDPLHVRVTRVSWVFRLALNPAMAVGDAYVAGVLRIEQGSLGALADLFGRNAQARRQARKGLGLAGSLRRFLGSPNYRSLSRRNVAHHYDLPVDFYRRFLDKNLQYSCAFFSRPDVSLDTAQNDKIERLAAKLLLRPGQELLDIGCGWGGLSRRLAKDHGITVRGITLSIEQAQSGRRLSEQEGLEDRVSVDLTDYRDVAGAYDRIISVGMFEHVGRENFRTYFCKLAQLLKSDGIAVVHTIGRAEGPASTQAWIARRIFPGGYIPCLSEVVAAAEASGLMITDIEVLRLHYAETLLAWRDRFAATRAETASIYGEPFCRRWEFYLAISETAFRRYGHTVFQIQLAHRIDAAPISRDYMTPPDRGSRSKDGQTSPHPDEQRLRQLRIDP